jgi:two-component sensor histidine kinase
MKTKLLFSLACLLLGLGLGAQTGPADPQVVSEMPVDTNKVLAWLDLSKATQRNDLEKAYIYADSAWQLAEALDFLPGKVKSQRQMGNTAYYGSNFPAALDHYQYAWKFYSRVGDELNAAKMINNRGLVFRSLGQIDSAVHYFYQSLEVKEQLGDTSSMAYSYNTLGETFAMRKEFEKAEPLFLKALEGFQQTGNAPMEYGLYLNLGGFYRDQGKLAEALPYIQKGLAYYEVNGPQREVGRGKYILGGLYFDQGKYAESEAAYLESKAVFDSLKSDMRILGCLLRLSEVALAQGQNSRALELARAGRKKALELGTREQEAQALQVLIDVHKKEGNYRSALEYTESYHTVMDSVVNIKTRQTMAELEQKYESERRERELADLTAANQLNEINLARQQQVQRWLILIVVLVVIIAVLLFNQYRIKQRTNRVLREKNEVIQKSLEEKEVLLREIHHRVKNNLQFISSMLRLQTRHVSDPQTRAVLEEGNHRINSMALVHQKLYQEDNLTGVDMVSYIENLLDTLRHAYRAKERQIEVQTQLDPFVLDIDTALPIGLIVNELVTNSFKHAFAEEERGSIIVILQKKENNLVLIVKDNGKGLSPTFNLSANDRFGFELIESLASKLKARLELSEGPGLEVTLSISQFQIL